jgi:hypothetical protein
LAVAGAAALLAFGLFLWLGIWLAVRFGAVGIGLLVAVSSLLVVLFVALSGYRLLFGAPFVPVNRKQFDAVMALADIRPGETLFDLGSGDGRLVIAAARGGAHAHGWEIAPHLVAWSWFVARLVGVGKSCQFHWQSLWESPYGRADVVTCYLFPQQMARLERKLLKEMRPGARVVSVSFRFPHWLPAAGQGGVYLYVVPEPPPNVGPQWNNCNCHP